MIKCQACGRKMSLISSSHLKTSHGLTMKAYRKRWPKAKLASKAVRKKISKANQIRWATDGSYRETMSEAVSDSNNRRWKSTSYRRKMKKAQSLGGTVMWEDPERRLEQSKLTTESNKRRWREDLEYRENMVSRMQERWSNPTYQEEISALMSETNKRRWADDYESMYEMVVNNISSVPFKWTKPEKVVRRILKKEGVYKTGSKTKSILGFLPHGWLPTKGTGFSANADFVDYNNKLILMVDGNYWHDPIKNPSVHAKDKKVNKWCKKHGWVVLRISDLDLIGERKKLAKKLIRRLIKLKLTGVTKSWVVQ